MDKWNKNTTYICSSSSFLFTTIHLCNFFYFLELTAALPLPSLNNNLRLWHWLWDALVRQHDTTVHKKLVTNSNVLTQHRDVLDSNPLANIALPTDYRLVNPTVGTNGRTLQNHSIAQTNTCIRVCDVSEWVTLQTPAEKNTITNRAPSSMIQFGPIVTLGPITQPLPILTLGSWLPKKKKNTNQILFFSHVTDSNN